MGIINGDVETAYKDMLDNYITYELTLDYHVQVILFSVFLSGTVGMMQRSAGMIGATNLVAKFAKTPRSGQFACFGLGLLIFFDDYANLLLTGESTKALLDSLHVSREKLAFTIDATAAPVASVAPVSSWVGYEAGQIDTQLKVIEGIYGDSMTISNNGFAVFIQSIRYRYYPIFMLLFMFFSIAFQKEFGPMLIAERKVRAYDRTDGGDGKASAEANLEGEAAINAPEPDSPALFYNMLIPIVLLVFFIIYLIVEDGSDGSGTQTFFEKFENGNSYVALLYGCMATALLCLILYDVQIVKDGQLLLMPTGSDLKALFLGSETEESSPRFLMSVKDSVQAFLTGMARLFPAIVVLTLAWSTGSAMTAVGANRFFAKVIVSGVAPEWLPTLSFLTSFIMALATGTSWGTMSILFPLVMLPAYQVSSGDPETMYATVAGVLSGAVAGDHVSPISDTTVLACMASECQLIAHVETQGPYVLFVCLVSVLFGTIPVGFGAWPNSVGIIIGMVLLGVFVFFFSKPVISATGDFDIVQELVQKIRKDPEMETLREAVVAKFNGGVAAEEVKEVSEEIVKEAEPVEQAAVVEEETA